MYTLCAASAVLFHGLSGIASPTRTLYLNPIHITMHLPAMKKPVRNTVNHMHITLEDRPSSTYVQDPLKRGALWKGVANVYSHTIFNILNIV